MNKNVLLLKTLLLSTSRVNILKYSKDRKKKVDHDALGSKKQERFINLEKKGRTKHHAPSNKAPERNMEELMSIVIPEHITVKELSEKMMVKPIR